MIEENGSWVFYKGKEYYLSNVDRQLFADLKRINAENISFCIENRTGNTVCDVKIAELELK